MEVLPGRDFSSIEGSDISWWKFVATLPLKQVTIVKRYVKLVYNPLFFRSLGKSCYKIEFTPTLSGSSHFVSVVTCSEVSNSSVMNYHCKGCRFEYFGLITRYFEHEMQHVIFKTT